MKRSSSTPPTEHDAVAKVLAQWREVAPDLDLAPIEVIGRINRVATLLASDQHLGQTGLTRAEFDLLGALRRTGQELTPTELARETFASGAAVSKRLKVLQERGLVERRTDDRDRRISRISLTEAGDRLHAEHFPRQLDGDREMLADLAPDDAAQLAHLLAGLLIQLDGRAGSAR